MEHIANVVPVFPALFALCAIFFTEQGHRLLKFWIEEWRIFGWGTPQALEVVNAQHETTVHHIAGAHPIVVYEMVIAGLYGALFPILGSVCWNKTRESFLYRLLIPTLSLVPAFWMPFAYRSTAWHWSWMLFFRLTFAIKKFSVNGVLLLFCTHDLRMA
jgi:hypothetical protein